MDMPEVRVLSMKPDKPTTPDGQPLRYGVCRCIHPCHRKLADGKVYPTDIRLGWCRCFCHADEYKRMKENKEDGK